MHINPGWWYFAMMYDVFFLSYDEPHANLHWKSIQSSIAHARRIDGIRGIHYAHLHCAMASKTSNFFVIDGDTEITDTSCFNYQLPEWDSSLVHLWHARNPVNGLEYGWGGVKLFPKETVLAMETNTLDMTGSLPLKIIPHTVSITHFNTSAFDTWRSAFRESVKLSLKNDIESVIRLNIWKTVASGPYWDRCLRGAEDGSQYADKFRNDLDSLRKINDFQWLKEKYENQYRD